jgi:prevent-host-death family protein
MITVPVFEAKTRLSELLSRAERGEVITITRHGVPAARLVAASASADAHDPGIARSDAVAAAFAALANLRRGVTLDIPLREAVQQGATEPESFFPIARRRPGWQPCQPRSKSSDGSRRPDPARWNCRTTYNLDGKLA